MCQRYLSFLLCVVLFLPLPSVFGVLLVVLFFLSSFFFVFLGLFSFCLHFSFHLLFHFLFILSSFCLFIFVFLCGSSFFFLSLFFEALFSCFFSFVLFIFLPFSNREEEWKHARRIYPPKSRALVPNDHEGPGQGRQQRLQGTCAAEQGHGARPQR